VDVFFNDDRLRLGSLGGFLGGFLGRGDDFDSFGGDDGFRGDGLVFHGRLAFFGLLVRFGLPGVLPLALFRSIYILQIAERIVPQKMMNSDEFSRLFYGQRPGRRWP
jgi:hypothetical protein